MTYDRNDPRWNRRRRPLWGWIALAVLALWCLAVLASTGADALTLTAVGVVALLCAMRAWVL